MEVAARREAFGTLNQALERLDEEMQALWQELAAGKKLPWVTELARSAGAIRELVRVSLRPNEALFKTERAVISFPVVFS
jgi:hypothetical protein